MSGISVTLDGLQQLLRDMERLPDGLEAAAAPVITQAAQNVANEVRSVTASLPNAGKGPWAADARLSPRVKVVQKDTLRAQMESRAPHAWLYEYGSKRRANKAGANRGVMPASRLVGRVASQERQRMNGQLVRLFDDALRKVGRL